LVSRNESASVPAPTGTIPAALRYKRYIYTASIPTRGDRNAALPKFNEGLSAQRAKDLSAAITAYREAIQKDPAFYEAHFNLGVAAYDHGQISASLSAYEMALTLRPDSRDARYNFALALRAADYPLDALDELKKLTAWNAEEARVHFTLGNLYAQQLGQPSLARQHYERVLALEPNHPQAGTMRTWIAAQSR
jgi:tetratricopeptide (TPR) repeat protein